MLAAAVALRPRTALATPHPSSSGKLWLALRNVGQTACQRIAGSLRQGRRSLQQKRPHVSQLTELFDRLLDPDLKARLDDELTAITVSRKRSRTSKSSNLRPDYQDTSSNFRTLVALTPGTSQQLGLSRIALYRSARSGRINRIACGIYLPADAPAADWDRLEAATRRADATICVTSALAHHDLTDSIPAALDVVIPRRIRWPASTGAIAWHLFYRQTFDVGRDRITIPESDQEIRIYSPERSNADAFRLRGGVGHELARDALREWLRRGGKPALLIDIATWLPRAKTATLRALEMMS